MLAGRLPLRAEYGAVYLLAWITPAAMMYFNMAGLGVLPLALLALYAIVVRDAVANRVARDAPLPVTPALTAGPQRAAWPH
jgi:hypothetical protein